MHDKSPPTTSENTWFAGIFFEPFSRIFSIIQYPAFCGILYSLNITNIHVNQ